MAGIRVSSESIRHVVIFETRVKSILHQSHLYVSTPSSHRMKGPDIVLSLFPGIIQLNWATFFFIIWFAIVACFLRLIRLDQISVKLSTSSYEFTVVYHLKRSLNPAGILPFNLTYYETVFITSFKSNVRRLWHLQVSWVNSERTSAKEHKETIYRNKAVLSFETFIFIIRLLTFVVEVFGSRWKYTLSRQEIPRHIFKTNSQANMELNFSNCDNRTKGQVKANYFTITQGHTWRTIKQI